jgi:GR25 family glycosyltransferase involved in LPS biosynthesis
MTENNQNTINTYFDRIFIINLKKRNDRKEAMKIKLSRAGITNYEFVEAIDGSVEPYITMYNYMIRKGQFIESPGAFGILKSALKVLVWSKLNKFKKILILEDDAIFHKKFSKIFDDYINNKKIPNWKLLYFGTSMHEWRFKERCVFNKNGYIRSQGTIPGAFAIGIDSSIFTELINYTNIAIKPWDLEPLQNINRFYHENVIILYPYLVIADTRDSNIRDSGNLQKTADECKWNLSLYDLT